MRSFRDLAALTAVAAILMATAASAHNAISGMPYDAWCCNGADCVEISDSAVVAGPNGWIVTLRRGEHPMIVSDQVRHIIPYRDQKTSTDGRFHLCLYPNEKTVRCFYAPPSGV